VDERRSGVIENKMDHHCDSNQVGHDVVRPRTLSKWDVRHREEARSRQSEGCTRRPVHSDLWAEMAHCRVYRASSTLTFCRLDRQWGTLPFPTTRLGSGEQTCV
jgi:hypothetical protein